MSTTDVLTEIDDRRAVYEAQVRIDGSPWWLPVGPAMSNWLLVEENLRGPGGYIDQMAEREPTLVEHAEWRIVGRDLVPDLPRKLGDREESR